MTDRIALRGMRFLGRHGVELEMDLARPAATDELGDTIDYGAVFTLAGEVVEGRSFRLLEALAGAIADEIVRAHGTDEPRLASVEVRVRKPQAPLPGDFETVEVTVRRPGASAAGGAAG